VKVSAASAVSHCEFHRWMIIVASSAANHCGLFFKSVITVNSSAVGSL
jgi:hypothetical protein